MFRFIPPHPVQLFSSAPRHHRGRPRRPSAGAGRATKPPRARAPLPASHSRAPETVGGGGGGALAARAQHPPPACASVSTGGRAKGGGVEPSRRARPAHPPLGSRRRRGGEREGRGGGGGAPRAPQPARTAPLHRPRPPLLFFPPVGGGAGARARARARR